MFFRPSAGEGGRKGSSHVLLGPMGVIHDSRGFQSGDTVPFTSGAASRRFIPSEQLFSQERNKPGSLNRLAELCRASIREHREFA